MTDTYNLKDECGLSAFSLALSIVAENPELASKLSDLAEQANEALEFSDALKEGALQGVEGDIKSLAHDYSLKSESADMKFRAVLFGGIFDKTAQGDEALRIISDEILNTGGTLSEGIELFRLIDDMNMSSLAEVAKIMTGGDIEAAKDLVQNIRKKLSYYIGTDYSVVTSGSQVKLKSIIKDYENKIKAAQDKIDKATKKLEAEGKKVNNLSRWLDNDLKKVKAIKGNTIEGRNELKRLGEKYGIKGDKDLKKKLEKKLTGLKKAKDELDEAKKTKKELMAAQEYKDALKGDIKIIKDDGNPFNLLEGDDEWKFIKEFDASPTGRAKRYGQYVLARVLLTGGKDLPPEVIKVIKEGIEGGVTNYLNETLTEDWIMDEERTLEELLARAYTNTADLANDGQLRNIYRQRLMELASDSEISVKDVEFIESLINTLQFSSAGSGFSSVLKYQFLVRAANNLGLDIPASRGQDLWNSIVNLFKKKEKEFGKIISGDTVKLGNGIELTVRQLLELVADMLGSTNINKLIASDTLTDREILDIAGKYLIGDAKAGGNRLMELINAVKTTPTTDDTRGVILKTITGENVPKESKVGFFDFRRGLKAAPEVEARANFMERLSNANTLEIPNATIPDLTDNLEQQIAQYKGGFILVNDAQWKMNKRFTDAIDKVNHNADGTPVKAEERVTVIYPKGGLTGTIKFVDGKIIYRTSDSSAFNTLVRSIAIRTLGQSNIDSKFTKELQEKLLRGDVDAISEYNKLLEEDAKKYFGEMLGIKEEAYDEKLVPMLQELTGISFKNYNSIVDKVAFWKRVDDNFICGLKTSGNLDQEYVTVESIMREVDALTPKQLAEKLSEMFGLKIDEDMISEKGKVKQGIRDAYLNYQLAEDPIELLGRKGKLLAMLNGGTADDITVSQFKAMLQSGDFSSYKDIFFHDAKLTDEELDKHVKNINNMIFNSLCTQMAMNLVKMGYRLPMVNIRDLVYDYLMDRLNVNGSFARAFLFKNELPDTLEALRGVVNEAMPKELRFGYDDGFKFDLVGYNKEKSADGVRRWGYDNGENMIDISAELAFRDFKNGRSIADIAYAYGVPIEIADDWLNLLDKSILGRTYSFERTVNGYKYSDPMSVIILFRDKVAEKGTGAHELFHAIFNGYVPDTERNVIYKGLRELYGYDDDIIEEMLADLFNDYFHTGKFALPKKEIVDKGGVFAVVSGYIHKVFRTIKNWLIGVSEYEKKIKRMYDDILDFKYIHDSELENADVFYGSRDKYMKAKKTQMLKRMGIPTTKEELEEVKKKIVERDEEELKESVGDSIDEMFGRYGKKRVKRGRNYDLSSTPLDDIVYINPEISVDGIKFDDITGDMSTWDTKTKAIRVLLSEAKSYPRATLEWWKKRAIEIVDSSNTPDMKYEYGVAQYRAFLKELEDIKSFINAIDESRVQRIGDVVDLNRIDSWQYDRDAFDRLGQPVGTLNNKDEVVLSDGTIIINGRRMWGRTADWMNLIPAYLAINTPSVVNGKTVAQLTAEYHIPLFIGQDSWLANFSKTSLGRTNTARDTINGQKFIQSMINLRNTIPEGTASHELFHAVFLTLSPKETDYFITQAEKLYKLDPAGGHREANEMLADLFSEYFRTGSFTLPDAKKLKKSKEFRDWILQWFKKLSDWLLGIDGYETEVAKLFDDILSGKLKTTTKKLKKGEIDIWNANNTQQWKDYLANAARAPQTVPQTAPAAKVTFINTLNKRAPEVVQYVKDMYKLFTDGKTAFSSFDDWKAYHSTHFKRVMADSDVPEEIRLYRELMYRAFSNVNKNNINKLNTVDDLKKLIRGDLDANDLAGIARLQQREEAIDIMYYIRNEDAFKELEKKIKEEYGLDYRVVYTKGNIYILDGHAGPFNVHSSYSTIAELERLFDVYGIPHAKFSEIYNRLTFFPEDINDVNKLLQTELDRGVIGSHLKIDKNMAVDEQEFLNRFNTLDDEGKILVKYRLEVFLDLWLYSFQSGDQALKRIADIMFPTLKGKKDANGLTELTKSLLGLRNNVNAVTDPLLLKTDILQTGITTLPLLDIKYKGRDFDAVVRELYSNGYYPYEFNIVVDSDGKVKGITLGNPGGVVPLGKGDKVYHNHPNGTFFSGTYGQGGDLDSFMNSFFSGSSKYEGLILPGGVVVSFENNRPLRDIINKVNTRTANKGVVSGESILGQTVWYFVQVAQMLGKFDDQNRGIFNNVIRPNKDLIDRIINGKATPAERDALVTKINDIANQIGETVVNENMNRFIPRGETRAYLQSGYPRFGMGVDEATYSKGKVDSTGRAISDQQDEHFKESQFRDDDGNIITLYRGATDGWEWVDLGEDIRYRGNGPLKIFLTPDKDMVRYFGGLRKKRGTKLKDINELQELLDASQGKHGIGVKLIAKDLGDGQYEVVKQHDHLVGYDFPDTYFGTVKENGRDVVRTNLGETTDYGEKLTRVREETVLSKGTLRDIDKDLDKILYPIDPISAPYNPHYYEVYGDSKNPLVIDAKGAEWSKIDFNGEKMTTDAIADWAYDNGYDGVIFKNVKEQFYRDGEPLPGNFVTDDYVVFSQGQLKSVDNATPTEGEHWRDNNGYSRPNTYTDSATGIKYELGPRDYRELFDRGEEVVTELVPVEELDKLKEYDRRLEPKRDKADSDKTIDELKESFQSEGIRSPIRIFYSLTDGKAYIGEGNHRLAAAKELGMEYFPAQVYVLKSTDAGKGVKMSRKPEPFGVGDYYPDNMAPSEIGIENTTKNTDGVDSYDNNGFSRPSNGGSNPNRLTPGYSARMVERDNPYVSDTYSSLIAMAGVKDGAALPNLGMEENILEGILNKYYNDIAAATKGGKKLSFSEAQKKKVQAGYALDMFEQDYLIPRYKNFLTPQERSELLGLKYGLAVASDGESLKTIADYNNAVLDRYRQATNHIVMNNTIFSPGINSDININNEVEERQKQLLEQGATLKYVNGQIVITDIREDLLRELRNIPNTILGLENLKAIGRNGLAQMSNESVFFLLNVVQLAKNLDNKTNIIMQTIYKVDPRLARLDFFNTYRVVDGVPKILRRNLLSESKKLSKFQNTIEFDTETKKTILSKIKSKIASNGRVTSEELSKIVADSITENIESLSNSIKGRDAKDFKKEAALIYEKAFTPYTYLLDVPRGVKSSIANILAEQQKGLRLASSLIGGNNTLLSVMDNIYIYSMDGSVKTFRQLLEEAPDDINKILFNTDSEIIMAADEAAKKPTTGKISKRAKRKNEKANIEIVKGVENNYSDGLNAYLNDSETVSEAERKLLTTTLTAARQLAKKYTTTNRIAETDNALASINEEIIRRFKADILGIDGKLTKGGQRLDFGGKIQDGILSRWKNVQERYKYYYSMDIDQLGKVRISNPTDAMAVYLAKYFKEIEMRLGSLDGVAGVTTDMNINRAFGHLGEIVLNVKTMNGLYSLMSGIEGNQILKFFRFSNPKQASYVKRFVIGGEGKETVGGYRTYVDKTDEGLDRDWFNKTFATNFTQSEYKKLIQALTGFTIVDKKWKKMESALNFINSSNYIFRALMSYPGQMLTVANQSIAYFLRQIGWEENLGIEDLGSIDEIRKRTGILNGTYNEINWFNGYSPDDLDPTSFYNRYGIPDVEDVYKKKKFYSTDDIETIYSKIDEYGASSNIWDKINDKWTKFIRNTDAYKDNANNIIDGIFARNFKNIAFVRALQSNQVMRFSTAEQFARFMSSGAPESMKKRLLDAVASDSGKHFRNILGLGFSGLDRAVSGGNKYFPAWASNILVGLAQIFNFRGAWGQNIARQTNSFFVTALKMGKMGMSKEGRDAIALYLARQPEFVNFAQQLFMDLRNSWRLVRFQDNGQLPDENDTWSWLDFISYSLENMKFASQWWQGIQSYGTSRIITEWGGSVIKSHVQPDIYKDTWGVGAFFNALAKNAGRNWKVPKFIMGAVAQGTTNGSEAFWEYMGNEWWKLSYGTLRYLMNEDYTSYGYSTELPTRKTGIPFIITGEINEEGDKAFSFDLANTETWENIANRYEAKQRGDTEAASIYAMNLWDTAFNSSQFLGTIKGAGRAINGSSLVGDTIKGWMDDMHFYKASNPFDLAEAGDLIAETEAGAAMEKYGRYIPSQAADVKTFIDTIIGQSDFRPGNKGFNKSFFNFDNSGHMKSLDESNERDAAMEMLLTNMKYKRDENWNFVVDEKGNKIVTDYWEAHMDEIERKINDSDFLINSNFNFIYDWVEQNRKDPNYMLYKKLIGEGLAGHYLEQEINNHISGFNDVYGLKKTAKLDLTELRNSELYDVVIPAMKSWSLVTRQGQMPFLEALATLDEDSLREADIKIVEKQLGQLGNQEAIKKFFNVNDKGEVSLTTKYEEFLEEQGKLSSYLRQGDIDSFLAETASITKVFKKDDPYAIMTTTLLGSRVNQINNSNYLSAEQKAKAINVLFKDNAEFIQQHIPDMISELGDVAETYIDQMNDSLYGSSIIADKLITDNEMNNSSSGRSAAKSASDTIKAVIVDLAKAVGDSEKIGVKRYNYNFTPVKLNGTKLLNLVGGRGYEPESPAIVVTSYTPHADFSIAKDVNRSVKGPKTETVSKKKQLSKLESDVTKALEAE